MAAEPWVKDARLMDAMMFPSDSSSSESSESPEPLEYPGVVDDSEPYVPPPTPPPTPNEARPLYTRGISCLQLMSLQYMLNDPEFVEMISYHDSSESLASLASSTESRDEYRLVPRAPPPTPNLEFLVYESYLETDDVFAALRALPPRDLDDASTTSSESSDDDLWWDARSQVSAHSQVSNIRSQVSNRPSTCTLRHSSFSLSCLLLTFIPVSYHRACGHPAPKASHHGFQKRWKLHAHHHDTRLQSYAEVHPLRSS